MAHHNIRVRNAAAMLLVALVPNNNFRQAYRTSRTFISPNKDAMQVSEILSKNFSGISSKPFLFEVKHGFLAIWMKNLIVSYSIYIFCDVDDTRDRLRAA